MNNRWAEDGRISRSCQLHNHKWLSFIFQLKLVPAFKKISIICGCDFQTSLSFYLYKSSQSIIYSVQSVIPCCHWNFVHSSYLFNKVNISEKGLFKFWEVAIIYLQFWNWHPLVIQILYNAKMNKKKKHHKIHKITKKDPKSAMYFKIEKNIFQVHPSHSNSIQRMSKKRNIKFKLSQKKTLKSAM